ncbi:MAG: prolipoprotein diacylglyceryl transferase [archaeon]
MIPYKQFQEIHIGALHIQVWGLIVAIGIVIGLILALQRAKKLGIKQAWIYDLTFYSILSGLIGSRIGYILFSWPDTVALTFLSAIDITKGGLSFTFGFLAAAIVSLVYMKNKKIKILRFVDVIIPYVVLAHAICRVGCFLIGDHIGKATNFFLGVMIDGVVKHNVALYEVLILLAIFGILIYLRRFKRSEGLLFASYLMLYPLFRFQLDFLRIDEIFYGLTAAQYVLVVMFIAGGILLTRVLRKK